MPALQLLSPYFLFVNGLGRPTMIPMDWEFPFTDNNSHIYMPLWSPTEGGDQCSYPVRTTNCLPALSIIWVLV